MSAAARIYLGQALDIMQEHALNREQIDWERLRGRAHARAGQAGSPEEVYPAIKSALRSLGESHSYFLTPEQVADLESGAMNAQYPDPSGRLLDNGLAYVSVPAYASAVGVGQEYAVTLQEIIRELDASQPCGWIVDLRENVGGSLWPMLAGIGPVLGEGMVGVSAAPDGQETPWYYVSGKALEGDEVQIEVPEELVCRLHEPLPPVAILTGDRTMSSGEAIAVAFRGRPDARSFGRPTVGLSTGVQRFILSDGAWIQLAVCRMADRTGQIYGGIIPVDEYIRQDEGAADAALEAAADWLLGHPNCTSPDG